ncbi:MAG: 23S rRNA (adenine(2503)-C(2))-methyltransferase RlmN [Bacteroides sp.]|nr:23S rRNA (adenine(2503)-C(2))-methyltransferase RlmN [Bacillota bacterium]MCM1394315.1 23S rRNA (adenine(2503)-C(2))-methyltransferase RlmN [[Eubacterium] siraeum]MCM1455662.1 23S rRNA (adenine(2503)-C(2))-methyltransferase RlmN [Bacteroides sp.]
MTEKRNEIKPTLLGLQKIEIADLLPNYPSFCGTQIFGFLADGKDFDEMTSLKKELRAYLAENFIANPVKILRVYEGKGGTKKYLFKLQDGNLIEGVYMPHDYGNTLCLSTQIGCRMGCTFCASGLDGLVRNLTVAEMLGQVIAVNRNNGGSAKNRAVAKLVLMGSGEPFDNYENVLAFLTAVGDENGLNIGERNISLSTSGLCDKIMKFADSGHKVTLSISLHAPFDDMRSALMPVNKAYGIDEIVRAAKYYFQKTGRRVIFEYTLIRGKNDSDACAKQLAKITAGFPAHVNLIRLNEVKENDYRAPSADAATEFLHKLEKLGVSATIRRNLGGDIEGACGQLRRRYLEETADEN